jgi:pantoate--beta-alanine ligase
MNRLTYLIKPNKIFMGEKDFQQFYLVKKLLEKKYSTKVIMCKTIRNSKGLALSSRNKLLSKKQINIAEKIITSLKLLKIKLKKLDQIEKHIMDEKKILEKKFNCKIQYLELRNKKNFKKTNKLKNSKLFVAFFLKKVRLIDNF